MQNSELTVATYNVLAQCFVEPERYAYVTPATLLTPETRQKSLRDTIAALDAQIILLQEVEAELLADLHAHLGHRYHILWSKRPTHSDGCAILLSHTDVDLLRQHTLAYQHREAGYSQVACVAAVRWRDLELTIISTHLRCGCQAAPGAPPLGQLQMRELLAFVQGLPERPCILGGDLNATPQSPTLSEAYAAGFRRAGDTDTAYIRGKRGKRDYLLHTGATLRPLPGASFKQLPNLEQPSDHVVLQARLGGLMECT